MQEIKRRYVIPGDKIVEGNYKPLMNVMKSGDFLISTRIGIAEAGRDGVKVIPLSGVYIPRVNDLVIGKVIDRSSLSWDIDINSCFFAHLPAQDVFGRDFSPARDDMGRQLNIGDLIIARIVSFDRTRDPMLTVQDKDLGKIPYGEFIKISPTRVPRLIGKRGSMIQTIEQATQTRVIIGQNGIVVVTGRDNEGLSLAVKAIKMVEEESHTTNLTQRVKSLLNVQDPSDSQSENLIGTPNTNDNSPSTSSLSDSQIPRSSNSDAQLNSHTLGQPSSSAGQPQQQPSSPPISTATTQQPQQQETQQPQQQPSSPPISTATTQQQPQQPSITMETQTSPSSINSPNIIAKKQSDNDINMTNNDQKEKKQEDTSEGVQ